MALINCKECKAKVSDQAKACPKCGAPLKNFTINTPDISKIFLIFKSNFFNFGNNFRTFIGEIKKKDFSFSSSKKFLAIYFSIFSIFFILILNTAIRDTKEKVQMSYEVADLLITSFNEFIWFRENSKRQNYNFIDKKDYDFCIEDGKIAQQFKHKNCAGLRFYIGENNLNQFTFKKVDKNNDDKISRDEFQKQLINNQSRFINNPKIKTKAKDLLKFKSNKYFLEYINSLNDFNRVNYGKKFNSGNLVLGYINDKDLNRDFTVTKNELITYEFYRQIMPLAQFVLNNKLPETTIRSLKVAKNSTISSTDKLRKRKFGSNFRSNRNQYRGNNNMFMSADQRLISQADSMYRRASICYSSLPSGYKDSTRKTYYDASKFLRDGKKYLRLNNQKNIGISYLKNSIQYSNIVLQTGRAFGSNSCK